MLSLLLTSVSWSEDVDYNDLVKRDGLYYEKFTDKPFTGKVNGRFQQGKIKDGKKHGEWLWYHLDGQLGVKKNYKDGDLHGEYLYYDPYGKLDYKLNYKDGKLEGERLSYYDNGQLSSKGNYKDGKAEGEWLSYYDNGQLYRKRNYKDGQFISETYH